ncbi:MAG TPA: extracellular solute-binding protein [Actinomycetota bacterium]|nr:extracellular solute-binding protein [Actinomycetota bacterium]
MEWRRVSVAALSLSLVVMVACGGNDEGGGGGGSETGGGGGEPVTLDFWVFEEGLFGYLDTLEKGFEETYPKVDLVITTYPEDNYGVKLDTAIAAGKEPDLVLVWGPDQARAGLLLPLDDMIAEKGIDLSTYVPSIVQPGDEFSCAYEDHLYCLGSYAGSVQMLYNKDLFDAAGIPYPATYPPMTPEQMVDVACQLTDEANGVWGAAVSDPLAYLPWEMFFSPDGKTAEGYVNGPDVVHQFEVLASAYERGCIPSSNILDPWQQGRDFFAKGKLGMVITDFQGLPKIEDAGINYGSTASPTPTGLEPYFFVWTDGVGVMASSDSPDEALDFVGYLTTEGQYMRQEINDDIPLDLAVAEEVDWAGDIPGRQDGLEVLSHARSAIWIPNRWDVIGPYYDAWGYVVGGDKTAQEALDEAAPAIQENLDKAWEVWNSQG